MVWAGRLRSGMTTLEASATRSVHRFEVRSADAGRDPRAERVLRDAAEAGFELRSVRVRRVYLIEGELAGQQAERVLAGLLADPVTEQGVVGADPVKQGSVVVEVHPLPGVMDPAAQSVADALRSLIGLEARVQTGWRYDLAGDGLDAAGAIALAERLLANRVVHGVHGEPFWPGELPKGHEAVFHVQHVAIRALDDAQLLDLSRAGHLFLDLAEMKAIQAEYQRLDREPTDIELETLAQTWSEHCVHKTLKSKVSHREADHAGIDWAGRPGVRIEGDTIAIDNLLRSTVAAATHELIAEGIDWTLSVFVDNAGIVKFDDQHAVCIKVETHNHPSALEPYGGAATGIGGCIRDIIGTGLAAKPIASTDVFCVAMPDMSPVPEGCIPPARVLSQVVAGVRDYGNRMGIPTIAGAVAFDDRYVGNPLVYCGCVGIMPIDRIAGDAKQGDLIVALGGRTGRDGIHGATFSSAELTETHADEFSHAVQIGNAIEEKRVLDAILRARDFAGGCLFSAITDCGAGGFSSAVGEMGEKLGAVVDLDRAPLKYDGLSYTEIWISEAQERMVLAVPADRLDALRAICREEHVELAVLGTFGTEDRELVLRYRGEEVGRLSMAFLHDGLPDPTRASTWSPTPVPIASTDPAHPGEHLHPELDLRESLLEVLRHPTVASKHWIVRQYDHEVQGNTVIRPMVGPDGVGPGDGSVIEPVPGTGRGLALGCGLATPIGDPELGGDPYQMALAAIDECVRNLVCVGADPERIAILDNFCWPSCAKPENLGRLVRASAGCYDGAKAYRTPFVSGKDSLNNQFTTSGGRTIEIPPTLLITGMGIVPDIGRCVTSDAKRPGNELIVVGATQERMGGSLHSILCDCHHGDARVPTVDLQQGPALARAVAGLIARGLVASAHDVSDGGVLAAVAEMLIGAVGGDRSIGATIDLTAVHEDVFVAAFSESPSRYVLEVSQEDMPRVIDALGALPWSHLGRLDDTGRLGSSRIDVGVGELVWAWRGTLDW